MSKIIKIVMGTFVAVLLLVGGAAYYVSTQINSEEIKKLIIKSVTDAMPATNVSLEKVEYELGLSVLVYLQNFELRLKKEKTPLFQVAQVELKIPIWAILTGGGAINAQISSPNAYYIALNAGQTNWQKALPKAESEEKKSDGRESSELKVPKMIENSRIDVKVSDLNVEYRPWQKELSKFKLSKIILKNINLKSSTAYEIKSNINYALKPEQFLKTDLQMIGEVNIGKFLKDKSLSTAVVMNLSDTSITGMNLAIPNLENKLKVNILSDGTIETDAELRASNLAEAVVSATMVENKLSVNKFKLNLQLSKLGPVLPADSRKSLQLIDFGAAVLDVTGDAVVDLAPMALSPNFTIDMSRPVNVKVSDDLVATTSVKGTLKGKQLNLKIVSDLFDGSITSTVATEVDPLNLPAELENFPLTKVSMVATNIKLSRNFLQETLYGKKEKAKAEAEAQAQAQVPGEKVSFPPVDLELEGKNIFVAQEELEFTALMQVRKNKVSSENFHILYSKGRTDIKFTSTLVDTKNINNIFDVRLKSMGLSGLNSMLPPIISQISGVFDGELRGGLNLQPAGMKYDVKAKLTATNGDLKDLDVKQLVANFFENYKDKVPKEYEKISNKFDKLVVEANASNKAIEFKKFQMLGDKKSVDLVLDGSVSMQDEFSKLTGTVVLPQYSAQMKQEFGTDKLPIQFDGQGFILKPNLTYTTGKLVNLKTKMMTTQVKQQLEGAAEVEKKRLQKEATKELEKRKKELEEKGKQLLKGIKL